MINLKKLATLLGIFSIGFWVQAQTPSSSGNTVQIPDPTINFNFSKYPGSKNNIEIAKKMANDYFTAYKKEFTSQYSKLSQNPAEFTVIENSENVWKKIMQNQKDINFYSPENIKNTVKRILHDKLTKFKRGVVSDMVESVEKVKAEIHTFVESNTKRIEILEKKVADLSGQADQGPHSKLNDLETELSTQREALAQQKKISIGALVIALLSLGILGFKYSQE